MKVVVLCFVLINFLSGFVFSQEKSEEFIPIKINEKDAFISTKTGEYIFRAHEKTDPTQLVTTNSGVVYTDISLHLIKKGESLYTIAKHYDLTVDDLKRDNTLSSINLDIGQELKIKKKHVIKSSSPVLSSEPSRVIATLPPNVSPASIKPPPNTVLGNNSQANKEVPIAIINKNNENKNKPSYYIVKKGDTLYSIAKQHNLTVQELKKINNLTLNNLSIGKKLLLK